ncbi:hypothetical protein NKR23_g6689 [Pleurostoma richardsiae]|uniref:Uncharacterized protein n=1 Tax=Pleurostoma richardsiae TaxID=41990 RepID=A0AA38VE43_9PEZI|nr:hypothetical protein NKR23_g6689 [Pleurostoma richardsiae]
MSLHLSPDRTSRESSCTAGRASPQTQSGFAAVPGGRTGFGAQTMGTGFGAAPQESRFDVGTNSGSSSPAPAIPPPGRPMGMAMGMAPGATTTTPPPRHVPQRALPDYQLQLMLLEQQNRRRLMQARQEQEQAAVRASSVDHPPPPPPPPPNWDPAAGHAGGGAAPLNRPALEDYLAWREQQNRRILMQARQEQEQEQEQAAAAAVARASGVYHLPSPANWEPAAGHAGGGAAPLNRPTLEDYLALRGQQNKWILMQARQEQEQAAAAGAGASRVDHPPPPPPNWDTAAGRAGGGAAPLNRPALEDYWAQLEQLEQQNADRLRGVGERVGGGGGGGRGGMEAEGSRPA